MKILNKIKKIDFNKQFFSVPIHWALILAFVAFWSYGYIGSVGTENMGLVNNILISIILYGIFLMFLIFWHQYDEYKDNIIIFNKDIVTFFSYFVFMFIFSFDKLTNDSLVGDQLYHAQASQPHFLYIISTLPNITTIFNDIIFSNLLYLLNLLTLSSLAILYFLLRNKSFFTKVILLSLAFSLFRITLTIIMGYHGDTHPPFRLFPLWFSSSIFSCTDLSFRLPQFLGLVTLMWLSQRIASRNLTFLSSWFFGLAIGTIPVLWYVGILVEQSIWTAIIWTLLLMTFAKNSDFINFNWIRWFSVLSIFSLMRVTAFIGLIPLFLFFLIYDFQNNNKKHDIKKIFFTLAPVLVMLPFILQSIILGTPATYVPGEVDYFPIGTSSIERVLFAITSGIAPNAILNSVMIPWVFFFPFAFVLYQYKSKRIINSAIILLFFILTFYVFYAIRPHLWGNGRYQAEYIIPFVILGFYLFSVKISEISTITSKKISKITSKILIIGFICLVCYNIFTFSNIYSQHSYDYRSAFKEIKNSGYAGSVYVDGVTYGVFGEIMNDFTIEEVMETKNILKKLQNKGVTIWKGVDIQGVNQIEDIKIILFVDWIPYTEKMEYLRQKGWKEWKEFKNEKGDRTIRSMIRGET